MAVVLDTVTWLEYHGGMTQPSDYDLTGEIWHDDIIDVTFTVIGYSHTDEDGDLWEVHNSALGGTVKMYDGVIERSLRLA